MHSCVYPPLIKACLALFLHQQASLNVTVISRTCLELKCRDGSFTDNYGNKMDRSGLCLDKSQSVKVKVSSWLTCSLGEQGI